MELTKRRLKEIIAEEIQNVVKEQAIDPKRVMVQWMSPDPTKNPELLNQRVMNTGLDALIGLNAWMKSAKGKAFLVQDDARVRKIKGAIESAIQFKQANKGAK